MSSIGESSSQKVIWQAALVGKNVCLRSAEITHRSFCSCYFSWWPSYLNSQKTHIPRAATDFAMTWKDLIWQLHLFHIVKNTEIDTKPTCKVPDAQQIQQTSQRATFFIATWAIQVHSANNSMPNNKIKVYSKARTVFKIQENAWIRSTIFCQRKFRGFI